MKKLITGLLVLVGFLFLVFYFIQNKNNPQEDVLVTEQDDMNSTNNFSWVTEKLTPVGDSLPTYNLTLQANGQSYNINNYWKKDLISCRDFDKEGGRPAGTEPPASALSNQLCFFMAAGDLFYVLEIDDAYQVVHELVGDIPEEDKVNPTVLFEFRTDN